MKRYKVPIKTFDIPGGGTHLLVRVKIDNFQGFLLIDTGASNSVFDSDNSIFKDLSLHEKDDEMQSSGFNSAIDDLQTGKISSLKICHFKTDFPEAIFTSLSHINKLYKSIKLPKILGIIGSDFLLKFKANIDFKTKILYLEKI